MDILKQMIRNAKVYNMCICLSLKKMYEQIMMLKIPLSTEFVVNEYLNKYMASKLVVNQWNRK